VPAAEPVAHPPAADDAAVAELRDLLVQLGTAMSAAGDSVDAIGTSLQTIVRAHGHDDVEVGVRADRAAGRRAKGRAGDHAGPRPKRIRPRRVLGLHPITPMG
jgi:hypothetical protein